MRNTLNRTEFRLLWPFYITALVSSSFSVAVPVWVIFFQKNFSFLQISFALSLQSIAAILFEIPSGAVADVFGRKASVVTGIVLQGLLWLALPFIDHDLLLYAAFFLMGLLRTLESGADKAWMVDWLKENQKGKLIREMFIKIHSLHSAGTVVSSLVASILLFSQEMRSLFFVQGCGYIIESFLLFFFAKESLHQGKRMRMGALIANAVKTTKAGVCFVRRSKPLLYLLLATTFAVCSKDFGCIAWQPLLVDLSLPMEHLGIVFSIAGAVGIIAPFFAKVLLKKYRRESDYLTATNLVEFLFIFSLCLIHKPYVTFGVMVYLFAMLISNLQLPIMSSCFQSLIPSRIRATVASVQSVVFAVFSLIVTAVGGLLMDRYGPKTAMVFFSFLLIPAALFYMRIKESSSRLHIRAAPLERGFWKNRQACSGQWWVLPARWLCPPKIMALIAPPAVPSFTQARSRRNDPSRCALRVRKVSNKQLSIKMYHFPGGIN